LTREADFNILLTYIVLVGTGGRWKLGEKFFFNKRGAKLTATAFHRPTGLLVAGFSNGIFELFEVHCPPPHTTSSHPSSLLCRPRIPGLTFT